MAWHSAPGQQQNIKVEDFRGFRWGSQAVSILRQVSKLQERSQLLSTFEGAVRPNDTGARRGEASLLGRIEAQKLQFWERV